MDSVKVKGRSFLILADSSIFIERDTVFYLPDSIARRLKRDETRRSEDFYLKLKERLYKKRFTKELYDILFVDPGKSKPTQSPVKVQSNGDYKKYQGRRITKINIKKLEVFGTRITDTTRHTDSWAINVANDLHVYTKSGIIRNNLFFTEGDEVDPDLLTDSERVLRGLPYVKDARIYIISESEEEGVEILILVKDIWSISGEFDYSKIDAFDVGLIDKNFLGLGQELRNEFLFDSRNTPKIGYQGVYSVNNIYNTFITGELLYANSEPLDRIGVRFYKNFITPETKYAGGIEVTHENIQVERIYRDTTINFFTKFNFQDVWLGRSFLIDESNSGRTNLQFAGKYSRTRYLERPLVSEDTNRLYLDRNLYLMSVGLTRRSYEKSSLIAGFGRTEDIPIGYLAEFTAGREKNEFKNRTYLGWRLAMGGYIQRFGYIRPAISFGGYIENHKMEQGSFNFQVQYFSHLYRVNRMNLRQFFKIGYTYGINRFDNEFININDNNGIRGLSYVFLRGDKKLSLSSETVAFTPFYFLGFRFAIFGFADLAVVNNDNTKLLKNKWYQGYGLGVRLRNENLAFNTIQIRFGWYPQLPPDNSEFSFELTGQNTLGIRDFQIEEPAVIDFR